MSMSSRAPTEQQLAFRKALEAAIRDHGATLDATELLAITSHFVGQLVALQDQRRFTADAVMDLVFQNLQQGTQEVVAGLLDKTGGSA